ncbi:MAG: CCA tRNA nucleotidyltransferase [Phycisphaerales bacterium]|nr:CCA tRNA nucleotidyltransferase [Phycisphaerales bacterium]
MTHARDSLPPRDAAIEVVRTLRDRGFTSYFAGGCVRDELLGLEPKDYDVATNATPDEIRSLFTRTASVGASFGVMLVRDFGPTIEVATFRTDGKYSDSRRPDTVEFATAERDAERRDFTINAMFLDPLAPDGHQIIDFVGGQQDLDDRVLRAVGDPDDRLNEDHLRALRAIRFAARFGLAIDPLTTDAICAHASELAGVSYERVGDEVRKMMAHPTRPRAAELLQTHKLDGAIFQNQSITPELHALTALPECSNAPTALAAWAYDRIGSITLEYDAARIIRWHRLLNLSNADAVHFASVLDIAGNFIKDWPSLRVAERKRLASRNHADDALTLAEAINPTGWKSPRSEIESLSSDGIGLAPEPLITGEDLIALGITPGPGFKPILDRVYDAQLEGRARTKEDAINLAREASK